MILHSGVLAVLLSSGLITGMVCYAAFHAVQILAHWDLRAGSELQLSLERKTYLISTLLAYAMAFQLASYFLFIHTSDALASQVVGAMCAAGTLYATPYGYPALLLKTLNFLLAGVWLIVNHADNQGRDYPLIKVKYALLLGMVPLLLAGSALEAMHFLGLKPDVITSCCGSLFSATSKGIASEMAALPAHPMMVLFFGLTALTLAAGLLFLRTGRLGGAYGLLSGVNGAVSILALISFICLYFYELPTHHCPFCVLQAGYGHVGYLLYLTVLAGSVCGTGVGVLALFRRKASIAAEVMRIQRRLAATSLVSFALYAVLASWPMLFSSFTLG
jgi:hypothetical protein